MATPKEVTDALMRVRQSALLHAADLCYQQGQRHQRLAQRSSSTELRQKHAARSRIAFDCEIAILDAAQEELKNAKTLPTDTTLLSDSLPSGLSSQDIPLERSHLQDGPEDRSATGTGHYLGEHDSVSRWNIGSGMGGNNDKRESEVSPDD